MATEAMIAMAARKPTRPVGVNNPDATLHQPRGYEDADAEERRKAVRTVIRLALGRHDCPALASRPKPCRDRRHKADARDAREVLETCGLADTEPVAQLRCSTCHRSKPVNRFPKSIQTCKACLAKKKTDREARLA